MRGLLVCASVGCSLLIIRVLHRRWMQKPPPPPPTPPVPAPISESPPPFEDQISTEFSFAAGTKSDPTRATQGRWSRFRARVSSERRLKISPAIIQMLEACEVIEEEGEDSEVLEAMAEAWHTSSDHVAKAAEARAWVCDVSRMEPDKVPIVALSHWVRYRDFVDRSIVGRTDLWHVFAYRRLLGLPKSFGLHGIRGGDVADLISCLADRRLLGRTQLPRPATAEHPVMEQSSNAVEAGSVEEALQDWLRAAEAAYNDRFLMAVERHYRGLTVKEEGRWKGEYYFVQLADPQVGMLHYDREWNEELTMLRLAVHKVNALHPRFLVVSGDLINAFPTKDPQVAARQVASIKEALMEVDPSIPVVLQPGNHDIGQSPTAEDVTRYRSRFGDDYFSFWAGGVFYVAINSQYYCDDTHTKELRRAQDEWIEEQFTRAAKGAVHVVVLSHVPPFVGSEDEERGWSNWNMDARHRVLKLAEQAGVRLWLCGHFHGNAIAKSRGGVEVVVTSSCGGIINWTQDSAYIACQRFPDFSKVVADPPVIADAHHSGLRVVRVQEHKVVHRWLTLDEVPQSLEDVFNDELRADHRKPRLTLAQVMGLSMPSRWHLETSSALEKRRSFSSD